MSSRARVRQPVDCCLVYGQGLTAKERAALVADFAIHYKPSGKKPTLREKLDRQYLSQLSKDVPLIEPGGPLVPTVQPSTD